MPTPITLLVDDPCPLVHLYRYHHEQARAEQPSAAQPHAEQPRAEQPRTQDGRLLLDAVPNSFLDAFCDVVEDSGVRGKFSVVPSPAARGDIVAGVNGDRVATQAWLCTVRRRLARAMDFCPEGITHDLAVDLPSGKLLNRGESAWSQTQDRTTLRPYLARALGYLKEAGLDATGITSPWIFGQDVESEYIASIIEAQRSVYGRERSWYFLHVLDKNPGVRPWVAYRDGGTSLVSIASTVDDFFWRTIDTPRQDREFVLELTDEIITEDGRGGMVRTVLDAGGWPVLLTHWQSLYSNGLGTGLAVLEEVARRVRLALGDGVAWATCSELMERTLEAGATRPGFLPSIPPIRVGPSGGRSAGLGNGG
jgi:hypothetical protein